MNVYIILVVQKLCQVLLGHSVYFFLPLISFAKTHIMFNSYWFMHLKTCPKINYGKATCFCLVAAIVCYNMYNQSVYIA